MDSCIVTSNMWVRKGQQEKKSRALFGFLDEVQGVPQRFGLDRDPPLQGPGRRRFGRDEMIGIAAFEQVPVQGTVEFRQGWVVGVFGRDRRDEAVAALGSSR